MTFGNANARRPLFWIGLGAAALFAACRGAGMLLPFPWAVSLPAGFLLMVATPFLFASRERRWAMGLARARTGREYLMGVAQGGTLALACFGLGWLLFGESADNWFISVRDYYRANPAAKAATGVGIAFLIFTIPALVLSPFGEEIFFRGFLDSALRERLSAPAARWVDAAIFGAIHLFHHGVARGADGQWALHPLSGALWMGLMTGAALLFARLRERSGSLWPAVLAHATFNLVMNATIFTFLWRR